VTENSDGSISVQTNTFVPYCMLEGVGADTVWTKNVTAFTDARAVIFTPEEGTKISSDGIRIYDVYHTYR